MGKTKTKFIDDSTPVEEKKANKPEIKATETVVDQPVDQTTQSEETSIKKETNKKAKASKVAKRSQKKERKETRGTKYKEAREKVEMTKLYPLADAIELVKNTSYSKFEGTVEIHINTSVKNIRGLISLPYSAGKALKVAAMGRGAQDSGADEVITEDRIPEIEKGKIGFDVLVVTPDQMTKIARLARVLGPRGLMPNPKNGTISPDLKKAVSELQGGKTEYKTQKDSNVIHLSVGKTSQESDQIAANVKQLFQFIGKSKIKKITLAPTMGPGVRVNTSSI